MVLSQSKTFIQPGLPVEDRRGWLDIFPLHPLVLSQSIAMDVPGSGSRHGRRHVQSPATLPCQRNTR